jgi:hypothetical protein
MMTSWRNLCVTIAGVLAALLLSAPSSSSVVAQANPDSVKLRNDCRMAAQVLTTGHPGPHIDDALTTIGLCGPEAEGALLETWENDAFSEREFGILVTSTRAVANPRLVEAMFDVASNRGYSTVHRVAALLVLTTYADPYRVPWFDDLIGSRDELLKRRFGRVDHAYTGGGRETLVAPVMPRLLHFLSQMKDSDADPEMRTAAEVLRRNLR